MNAKDLAQYFDATLLTLDPSLTTLEKLCEDAMKFKVAAVCVHQPYVPLVAEKLAKSQVKPITVVSFPFGAETPHAKAVEAKEAVNLGAREIDMVMNIAALKMGDLRLVLDDIAGVVEVVAPVPVKVIIETGMLSREEKVVASSLVQAGGAAFVKTCTGFGPGGATVEDVQLIKSVVGHRVGIKASGGIKTLAQLEALVEAGASRIGTSHWLSILQNVQ